MKNILKNFFKAKNNSKNQSSFLKLKNQAEIKKIFDAFSLSDKCEIRFVGGCVRKILNNEHVDDIDLAVNVDPTKVKDILIQNNINFFETGIEHGTITATINQKRFEITSLRKDIDTDGRHAKVEFSNDWLEDASRRDFTINSIYSDLDGNLFDPFDGKSDLKIGKIKFIGNPANRIKEDYLRILRYIRFFAIYSEIEHEEKIKKIIKQNISGIKKISKERLLDELKKLFESSKFYNVIGDKFSLEIIDLIFPELKNIRSLIKLKDLGMSEKLNFISLICMCIIDETENSDYFLYKYNLSNESKKRVIFLKKNFQNLNKKNFFSKNNLSKLHYKYGPSLLNDLIYLKILKSNKIPKDLNNLREYFLNRVKPEFPVKAKFLMNEFKLKEGKELGNKLKILEEIWLNNNFEISNEEIRKQVLN